MPFKSESQRRFMFSKHPKIAQRWADTYGTSKNLPSHVGGGKKHPEAKARLKAAKRM